MGAPMQAGRLERTDQPSSSTTAKHCLGCWWYFLRFFPFSAWPDRSYLNQPNSDSDVFPNAALSCLRLR